MEKVEIKEITGMEQDLKLEEKEDDEEGMKPAIPIGTKVLCKWKQDSKFHMCEIIEKRKGRKQGTWEYYVHYTEFNRRLDEWVKEAALQPVKEEEKKDKNAKGEARVKTRQSLKRKSTSQIVQKVVTRFSYSPRQILKCGSILGRRRTQTQRAREGARGDHQGKECSSDRDRQI